MLVSATISQEDTTLCILTTYRWNLPSVMQKTKLRVVISQVGMGNDPIFRLLPTTIQLVEGGIQPPNTTYWYHMEMASACQWRHIVMLWFGGKTLWFEDDESFAEKPEHCCVTSSHWICHFHVKSAHCTYVTCSVPFLESPSPANPIWQP